MKKIIVLFYLGLLVADYGGGYAGSGFRYGSNARGYSLAGALAADKTPGFYAFSNPALLQYANSSQFGLSYQAMSLDRSIQALSFVKNLPPSAGMGLAVLVAGTGNIEGRDSEGDPSKTFSAKEIQGIISFGVSIGNRLALGIDIKAFFSSIAPEIIEIQSGNGIGWDVGFIYKLHRHLLLGAVFDNLKGSYNWKLVTNDDQDSYEELLPQTLKLGVAYTGFRGIAIYIQEDIVSTPGNYINYRSRLGIEYRLSKDIKLRGGLKQARGASVSDRGRDSIDLKPSFGIGIPLQIWQRQYIKLDYALDPGNVGEGLSHLFSISMELK